MCGILGQFKLKGGLEVPRFSDALNLMKYRGPDSFGIYKSPSNKLLLGHRRLSILDLSSLGSQPMSSKCGKYHLVFNGEIYNHDELRTELIKNGFKFNSFTDTEVLLNGYIFWGDSLLLKLNGPFSFAIYNEHEDQLILARDRMGEKPLFFSNDDNELIFSSELKPFLSLRNCSNKFNGASLVSYLSRGFPLQGTTLLNGVNALKPAHLLKFSLKSGNLKISRYWSSIEEPKNYSDDLQGLVTEFGQIFKNSVNLQLQCDVPACILLSGGVDSSLITAMTSESRSSVKTFTVKFDGHPKFDEAERARQISRYFNTDHTEISANELSPKLIEAIANDLDSPINDSSLIPTYLMYKEVSNLCKVALGGDGGDELFGGYKHYSRLSFLQSYFGFALPFLSLHFAQLVKRNIPSQYRWRNWVIALSCNPINECPNIREIIDLDETLAILNSTDLSEMSKSFYADWSAISSNHSSLLGNAIGADLNSYLPESILVKSDRTSMLNSVESRAPFLDVGVVNFAITRVPDTLKANNNNRKILLKEFGRRVLPPDFDFKRKLGFNLPLSDLIRTSQWKRYFHDVIYSHYSFLSRQHCIDLFEEHLKGANHADKLFGIVLLIRWSQINNVSSVEFN
jgi:asparagine synthase (glutamine-hydrolysing)